MKAWGSPILSGMAFFLFVLVIGGIEAGFDAWRLALIGFAAAVSATGAFLLREEE